MCLKLKTKKMDGFCVVRILCGSPIFGLVHEEGLIGISLSEIAEKKKKINDCRLLIPNPTRSQVQGCEESRGEERIGRSQEKRNPKALWSSFENVRSFGVIPRSPCVQVVQLRVSFCPAFFVAPSFVSICVAIVS